MISRLIQLDEVQKRLHFVSSLREITNRLLDERVKREYIEDSSFKLLVKLEDFLGRLHGIYNYRK